jgi:hypothetical protein
VQPVDVDAAEERVRRREGHRQARFRVLGRHKTRKKRARPN